MTDDKNSGFTGRPNTPEGGYEWTCPYCGMSRLNRSAGESEMKNAIAALRTHIIATGSDEHGPHNEYPKDMDDLTLAEHVVKVEGRR